MQSSEEQNSNYVSYNIHYLLSHPCFHYLLWVEEDCEREKETKGVMYQVHQHNFGSFHNM